MERVPAPRLDDCDGPGSSFIRTMAWSARAASTPPWTSPSTRAHLNPRRSRHSRRSPNATEDASPSSSSPAPSSSPPFAPATWRELDIDWGRRHLQCVFVDDGHGVLARGAEGVCQRVAKWAGAGHMVFPESAGVNVADRRTSSSLGLDDLDADASLSMLTRLDPICDHPRYATRAPYEFTDADAAVADLVITCGGAGVERKVRELAPSAAAVVDLWEFAQFGSRAELDGTGVAAIVQRSLARGVVAPCIEEAMKLRVGEHWGLPDVAGGGAGKDALDVARARTVIGVAGLVTFLLATSPLEEVERVTKR